MAPEWVYLITLILSFPRIYVIQRTVSRHFHYPLREVISQIYLRMAAVTLIAAFCPALIHMIMPIGWGRAIAVGFSSVLCTAATVYWIGSNSSERLFIRERLQSITNKIIRTND